MELVLPRLKVKALSTGAYVLIEEYPLTFELKMLHMFQAWTIEFFLSVNGADNAQPVEEMVCPTAPRLSLKLMKIVLSSKPIGESGLSTSITPMVCPRLAARTPRTPTNPIALVMSAIQVCMKLSASLHLRPLCLSCFVT